MGEEAEGVDVSFVGVVGADAADEDEVGGLRSVGFAILRGGGGIGVVVAGEGAEDEGVVLLRTKLGDVEEDVLARRGGGEGDGGDEGLYWAGRVEDLGEGVGLGG